MPRPMGGRGKGKGKGKDMKGKREKSTSLFKRKKFCRFTADKVKQIDYKDLATLKASEYSPLFPMPKPEEKKQRPPDKPPPPREAAKVPDAQGIRPPEKPDVISKSRPLPAPKTPTPVAAARSGAVETAAGDGALRPATRSDVGVEADGDPGPLTGYLGLLRDKVEANWEPPATLGQHGAVRAVIAFEISRAGGVPLPNSMQVRVSSGQPAFDRAAQRAVLNAAPFAPLPAGWGTDSIGIRFTFSGEY